MGLPEGGGPVAPPDLFPVTPGENQAMSKLSLTLKPESPLTLVLPNGQRVEIKILKASPSRIRVVVDAPPEVRILRQVDYSQADE
jgi:hypothetical protein